MRIVVSFIDDRSLILDCIDSYDDISKSLANNCIYISPVMLAHVPVNYGELQIPLNMTHDDWEIRKRRASFLFRNLS